jgi:hypothetical protein
MKIGQFRSQIWDNINPSLVIKKGGLTLFTLDDLFFFGVVKGPAADATDALQP